MPKYELLTKEDAPKFTEILYQPKVVPDIKATKNKITEQDVDKDFYTFIRKCHRCKSEKNEKLITKAYLFAKEAHKGETRYSGDAFINHLVEVAKIVTGNIGLSLTSAVCALLHDVVSNTEYTIKDIEVSFNKEIATIVENLTKIKGTSNYFDIKKPEIYKRILISLSEDIRIIYIKIADRLHNMRTINSLDVEKRTKVANETLFVYAPLAHRLGLYLIKSELEDLAFKCLNRDAYNKIANRIDSTKKQNINYLNRFSLPIIAKLFKENFKFDIISRQKSIYSIYKKMQKKNINFDDIYDIFAVRIIISPRPQKTEQQECNEIFNYFFENYEIKLDRIRNWIYKPKDNGYEAIHVTVKGSNNRWIEVQIRTERMNEIAEKGLSAHWKYKNIGTKNIEFNKKISKIKEKLENVDIKNFKYLSKLKLVFTDEIYVYTPQGRQIKLPYGASVLDFAFSVSRKLGTNCIGAEINNKLVVPIDYKIKTGDYIKILTSEKTIPKMKWLKFVKTDVAKKILLEIFQIKKIDEKEKGERILESIYNKFNYNPNQDFIQMLVRYYKLGNKQELYYKIGTHQIRNIEIENIIKKKLRWSLRNFIKPQFTNIFTTNQKILTINDDNYKIAKCCSPIPGDEVLGIKDQNDIITIHKKACRKMYDLVATNKQKMYPLTWQLYKAKSFQTSLRIEADNKIGILNKITTVMTKDMEVNIKSIHFESTENETIFSGWIEIYVLNKKHLKNIINKLYNIKGINNVERLK